MTLPADVVPRLLMFCNAADILKRGMLVSKEWRAAARSPLPWENRHLDLTKSRALSQGMRQFLRTAWSLVSSVKVSRDLLFLKDVLPQSVSVQFTWRFIKAWFPSNDHRGAATLWSSDRLLPLENFVFEMHLADDVVAEWGFTLILMSREVHESDLTWQGRLASSIWIVFAIESGQFVEWTADDADPISIRHKNAHWRDDASFEGLVTGRGTFKLLYGGIEICNFSNIWVPIDAFLVNLLVPNTEQVGVAVRTRYTNARTGTMC